MQFATHLIAENQLKVLCSARRGTPVVSVGIWYLVGSRNESVGITGASHWLEHQLHRGTATYPQNVYTHVLPSLGARWNAFTSKDFTCFHMTLPREYLSFALQLEADRMVGGRFTPTEVERERTVLLAERMKLEASPRNWLGASVDVTAYGKHPYASPLIGCLSDLQNMSAQNLAEHYLAHYHPKNALLVIDGDCDAQEIMDMVNLYFGSCRSRPVPFVGCAQNAYPIGPHVVTLPGPSPVTEVAFLGPCASDQDLAAFLIVDGLLSGYRDLSSSRPQSVRYSSRLYGALVEAGWATRVSTYFLPSLSPSLLRIRPDVAAGVLTSDVESCILAEVDRLSTNPVGQGELDLVKRQAYTRFAFLEENSLRRVLMLGNLARVADFEVVAGLREKLLQVSADDVLRVARIWLRPDNRTIGRIETHHYRT